MARRLADQGVAAPALIDVAGWDPAWSPGDLPPVPAPPGDAEQVALLQLSGGTTGVSKLIPRTHADYLYSVRASARVCELDRDTVMLVVLPVAHNFPMSSPGILGVLHVGGRIVLAPDPSPGTGFGLIAREGVTTVALVPPLAQAWVSAARRRGPRLDSLRVVQVGGARLAPEVAAGIGPVLGAELQQVFGMAEGLVNYTRADDPAEVVLGSQGRPLSPADEIRIVDEQDLAVAEGAEGALLTRGPYTIRGYYGAPDADRSSFTDDGFYRTGDLVRRLPSGHLVVIGRAKDQINRGGEKIAAAEIEELLIAHPAVLDAVAVGVPDPMLGERLCAVVRLEPGSTERPDLAEHLRGLGLATHKFPDAVEFVEELPATHVGKNSRRDLRRMLGECLGAR